MRTETHRVPKNILDIEVGEHCYPFRDQRRMMRCDAAWAKGKALFYEEATKHVWRFSLDGNRVVDVDVEVTIWELNDVFIGELFAFADKPGHVCVRVKGGYRVLADVDRGCLAGVTDLGREVIRMVAIRLEDR